MFDPNGKVASKKSREDVSKVSTWVSSFLSSCGIVPANVMVTEISCSDPGCVPIETLVIVLGPTQRWTGKVLKPLSDVTDIDIRQLFLADDVLSVVEETATNQSNNPTTSSLSETLLTGLADIRDVNERSRTIETLLSLLQSQKALTNVAVEPNLGAADVTVVKMVSNASQGKAEASSSQQAATKRPAARGAIVAETNIFSSQPRHSKGTRQRGCPCCDPDNIDNIVDKMLFLDSAP